jgi:hypothetical protein
VDHETLVVRIPDIHMLNLLQNTNRVVIFEVSMNGGHDWVSNTAASSTYTFKEVPYLLNMSHWEAPMTGEF